MHHTSEVSNQNEKQKQAEQMVGSVADQRKKRCSTCGKEYITSLFYKQHTTKDGLQTRCKFCYRAYSKRPEVYAKIKADGSANRKVNGFYKNKRRLMRSSCHQKVKFALKSGRIEKGICVICKSEDVIAHHNDYSKPLNVVWLCDTHHREYHFFVKNDKSNPVVKAIDEALAIIEKEGCV